MQIDLTGKVILVTGASRGIGHAIAKLAGECGATVAVHGSKNLDKARALAKEIGNNSQAFSADLRDPLAAGKLVDNVIAELGQLDVVVNNAGVAVESLIEKVSTDWLKDWYITINVNLSAVATICKQAIPHFQQNGGGIFINISSRAAFRGDTEDYLAYAASKGGVVSLTRSIARAFGKDNIKAFDVAPGFTRTEMAQEFIDKYGEDYVKDGAIPTLTQPEDIARTVVFLASGNADHATGTTIDMNAGSYVH